MNISEPFIRRPIATSLLMAGAGLRRPRRLSVPAGRAAAAGRLSDHPGHRQLPGRQRRDHGLVGRRSRSSGSSRRSPASRQMTSLSALGATTIVIQFDLNRNIDCGRRSDVQAAITAASKTVAAEPAGAADLQQGQPGRLADHDVVGALRHPAADHGRRLRRSHPRPADLPDLRRRPGLDLRRPAEAGDPHPGRPGQARRQAACRPGGVRSHARRSPPSNAAKGTINGDKRSFTIYANDQITEADKCNDVILAYRNGAPIRVRDIGQAVPEPRSTAPSRPGQNDKPGVFLVVFKQPGANVIETVDQIKAAAAAAHGPRFRRRSRSKTILDRTHDHPRLGRGRAVHARAHHRPGGDGDLPVPAQFLGHRDPEHHRAAGAARRRAR